MNYLHPTLCIIKIVAKITGGGWAENTPPHIRAIGLREFNSIKGFKNNFAYKTCKAQQGMLYNFIDF